MLGAIVNTIAVMAGAVVGLLLGKVIPSRLTGILMQAMGLSAVYIGLRGLTSGKNTLLLIFAMALGALLGEILDLDKKLNRLGQMLEEKLPSAEEGSFAQGLVSSTLLFCTGAMAIVGALQSGLLGNHEMLFSKSILDLITAMAFAASLGWGGVFASAGLVLLVEGGITLLAQCLAPVLTDAVIAEMSCVGSLLCAAAGFNILKITKLKVMNFIPAIFMPIALCPLFELIHGLF